MQDFIIALTVLPLLIGAWALFLKKNSTIHTYILVIVLLYAIATPLSLFFLRDVLFHAQSIALWNLVFIDQTNALFLVLIVSLSFVINLYASTYFKREVDHGAVSYNRLKQYPFLINMFIFSMIGVAISNNLICMRIGLEATTIFTVFLISIYGTETSWEAAWKYVLICSIGLTVGLFWFYLMLYSGLPSLNLHENLQPITAISNISIPLLQFAFLMILIGFGTKAAFFPMNTRLPDAHGKAPSPVSAFMSSILLPLALYVIYRAKEVTDTVIPWFASNALLIMGIITLVYAGLVLLRQKYFKRALAYSSSEHIGIIAIAFALNAPYIAFAHIIFHSFVKAASFMSAGNILLELDSWQFRNIRNIFDYMKYTPILLIISLIFLMWIPPSYMFVTEIWLIITAFNYNIRIAVLITVSILLATSGLLVNFGSMFGGGTEAEILEHGFTKVENDFHRNWRHRAIIISLLFPLLFICIASIGFGRIN
jgi:hydrogenase-4 component F